MRGGGFVVLRFRRFHVEPRLQVVLSEIERRGIVRIPRAHHVELPAPLPAKRCELVLADDVRRKAIGVGCRLAFGIGKQINLAMRLLKRLAHLMVFQPATPAQDGLHVGPNRMPHPHTGLLRRLDGMARPIHQVALPGYGGPYFAALLKLPDETGREMGDERMIEIPRLPPLDGASPRRDQLALQAEPLRRDLAVQLFHTAVEILDEFRVFFFDSGGSALESLTLAAPNQRRPLAADCEAGLAIPDPLHPDAGGIEAERRNGHRFQIVAGYLIALGCLVHRLFDQLAGYLVLDPPRQATQLRDPIES